MNATRSIAAAVSFLIAANAHSATQAGIDTRISIVWICGAVAAVVFAVIFYSVVAFRHVETKSSFVPKRLQELAWALVPMAIVIAAAAPSVRDTSRAADITAAYNAGHETLSQSDVPASVEVSLQVASR